MNSTFPLKRLSEVARPVSRPMAVVPGECFRTIGVRWWGEGAYERDTIDGSQTAAKTLSIVRENDLIINKIWVRHGSTAVANSGVDGCAASSEFPTFELDRDSIEPRWMHWLTKHPTFWDDCAVLSQGTSGKNRIRPELFLTISIPLPPLAEQRRLVARLDGLAAKIERVRRLRQQVQAGFAALEEAILAESTDCSPALTPLAELVTLREPDVVVNPDETYQFAGVYSFGRGVFRGPTKLGAEFSYRRLTRLRTGDLVYPKLMAWEGAVGVVPPECDGLVVSPEFPVFEVDCDRVLPVVLDVHFRSPRVWTALSGLSTGTNLRRRRIQPKEFLQYRIPVPSMGTQLRLLGVRRHTERTARSQVDAAQQLEVLFPAILDHAFRGDL